MYTVICHASNSVPTGMQIPIYVFDINIEAHDTTCNVNKFQCKFVQDKNKSKNF